MRVLITRPERDAESLVAALAELEIESLVEPLFQVEFEPDPALDLDGVQAVLLTSRNGAEALARAVGRRDLAIFAVGDATGRAASEAGFRATKSAGGAVEDLAKLVADALDPAGGPLLHVAGRQVAGDLAGLLEADGFEVRRAVLYQATAATALSETAREALGNGEFDAVLLFSPRTAGIFADLVEAADLEDAAARLDALCLSEAVADATRLPFRQVASAARPTQDSLIELVVAVRETSAAHSVLDTVPSTESETEPDAGASIIPETGTETIDEAPVPKQGAGRKWRWTAAGLVAAFVVGIVAWPVALWLVPPLADAMLGGITAPRFAALDDRLAALEAGQRTTDPQTAEGLAALQRQIADLKAVPAAPAADLGPLEDRLAALDGRIAELAAGQAEAEQRLRDETASVGEHGAQLARLDQQLAGLAESLAAAGTGGADVGALAGLNQRLALAEQRLSDQAARPAADPDAARRIATLAQSVAELEAAVTALGQRLADQDDRFAAGDDRLAGLETALAAGRGSARGAGLILAVTQLDAAARGAAPFARELAALRALGADDPALDALAPHAATGAATLTQLRRDWPAVAREVVVQSRLPETEGWITKTLHRLGSIVTVREIGEVEGTDPVAMVARAEARLEAGDLAAAVDQLAELSGVPADAAAGWLARARARLAVDGARAALQRRSIAAVGNPAAD